MTDSLSPKLGVSWSFSLLRTKLTLHLQNAEGAGLKIGGDKKLAPILFLSARNLYFPMEGCIPSGVIYGGMLAGDGQGQSQRVGEQGRAKSGWGTSISLSLSSSST